MSTFVEYARKAYILAMLNPHLSDEYVERKRLALAAALKLAGEE